MSDERKPACERLLRAAAKRWSNRQAMIDSDKEIIDRMRADQESPDILLGMEGHLDRLEEAPDRTEEEIFESLCQRYRPVSHAEAERLGESALTVGLSIRKDLGG